MVAQGLARGVRFSAETFGHAKVGRCNCGAKTRTSCRGCKKAVCKRCEWIHRLAQREQIECPIGVAYVRVKYEPGEVA